MRIVYCGFGRAGRECLLQLLSTGRVHKQHVQVYTHTGGANQEFLDMLDALGMDYETSSVNKHLERIQAFGPDVLLSVYYRNIIRQNILDTVGGKAMNLHPSLLPDYKGCLSSVHALLNAEVETGYTFHYVTPEVDAGNILLQERMVILPEDNAFSLYHKLLSGFVRNFNTAFDRLVSGDEGLNQDGLEGPRRYFGRELPHAGKLVAAEVAYDFAERFVRAMHFPPFPGAIFVLANGEEVEVQSPRDLEPYRSQFQ